MCVVMSRAQEMQLTVMVQQLCSGSNHCDAHAGSMHTILEAPAYIAMVVIMTLHKRWPFIIRRPHLNRRQDAVRQHARRECAAPQRRMYR